MQPTGTVLTTLIGDPQGSFLSSLVKIQLAVSVEMLFKEIVDARTDNGRRTLKDHKSSLSTSWLCELKAHAWCTKDKKDKTS